MGYNDTALGERLFGAAEQPGLLGAWGGKVAGAIKLYKHGGVSFMECLPPWVVGA